MLTKTVLVEFNATCMQ